MLSKFPNSAMRAPVSPQGAKNKVVLFIIVGVLFVLYNLSQFLPTNESAPPKGHKLIVPIREVDTFELIHPTGVLMYKPRGLGLGSQLFFYAASYALSRNLKIPLFLPVPADSSKEQSKNSSYRGFGLHNLALPKGTYVSHQTIDMLRNVYYVSCGMAREISWIPQEVLDNMKYFAVNSFCFSADWFRGFEEELKEMRVIVEDPSQAYLIWRKKIKSVDWPVAVHVRRGGSRREYLNTPPMMGYFKKAMRRMKVDAPEGRSAEFFVFSDDIGWTQASLVRHGFLMEELGVPVYFISASFGGLTHVEELDLMINCKSIVISSSSFSWWAAYLMKDGKEKKVIRPKFNAKNNKNSEDRYGMEYEIGFPRHWIPVDA